MILHGAAKRVDRRGENVFPERLGGRRANPVRRLPRASTGRETPSRGLRASCARSTRSSSIAISACRRSLSLVAPARTLVSIWSRSAAASCIDASMRAIRRFDGDRRRETAYRLRLEIELRRAVREAGRSRLGPGRVRPRPPLAAELERLAQAQLELVPSEILETSLNARIRERLRLPGGVPGRFGRHARGVQAVIELHRPSERFVECDRLGGGGGAEKNKDSGRCDADPLQRRIHHGSFRCERNQEAIDWGTRRGS